MPYENEYSCRINDPGKYDRFARKNCSQKHDGKCIDVIYGIKAGKSEIQALRYNKKIWNKSAARSHCKSRNGRFEAAQEANMNKERILLYMHAELKPNIVYNEKHEMQDVKFDRSTILVGDMAFNGIYFPKDEVEKSKKLWDTKPIIWDHSPSVKDTIGDVTDTKYDTSTGKLSIMPVIEGYMDSENAKAYISRRKQAGAIPNVSAGVWLDRCDEKMKDGEMRLTARNLEPEHVGIVRTGACNPEAGCGIGLEKKESIPIQDKTKMPKITVEVDTTQIDDALGKLEKLDKFNKDDEPVDPNIKNKDEKLDYLDLGELERIKELNKQKNLRMKILKEVNNDRGT